jgi:long-chain fatty acid transport protein
MRHPLKAGALLAFACIIMLVCPRLSPAGGFSLFETSVRGNALGGALVARADDPTAVFFNPAGITQLPGTQVAFGASLSLGYAEIKTKSPQGDTHTTHNDVTPRIIPYGYLTRALNDRLWFGIGLIPKFASGARFPSDWPGRYNSTNAVVKGVEINPSLAWKATEALSLAAGLRVMRLQVNLDQNVPIFDYHSRITGDSVAAGWNAAIHYKAFDWAYAGVSYRSRMTQNVGGRVKFTGRPDSLRKVFPNTHFDMNVNLPTEIYSGVVFFPRERLSIETSTVFTMWRGYEHLRSNFDEPVAGLRQKTIQKDWRNVWRYQIGMEYKAAPWLDLRLGFVYDNEPQPRHTVDYTLPCYDRIMMCSGLGFHWNDWSFDTSYTFKQSKKRDVKARPADGVLDGEFSDTHAHYIGCGMSYKF